MNISNCLQHAAHFYLGSLQALLYHIQHRIKPDSFPIEQRAREPNPRQMQPARAGTPRPKILVSAKSTGFSAPLSHLRTLPVWTPKAVKEIIALRDSRGSRVHLSIAFCDCFGHLHPLVEPAVCIER
jgi:hypothetical protein